MKSLIKKITTKDEADKVIKDAAFVLYVLVALELFATLVTSPYTFDSFIRIFSELVLITLLRQYRSRFSGFALIAIFLPPLIYRAQNFLFSGADLETIVEYLIRIFLSIRASEAALRFHGRPIITPKHISIGYKIYFWLILIAFGYFSVDLYVLGGAKTYDYIDLPFTMIGFVGLFGFAYRKAIFQALTWKRFFPITIVWAIIYGILVYEHQPVTPLSPGFKLGATIFLYALSLPYYVALYLYGYRSEHIWKKE